MTRKIVSSDAKRRGKTLSRFELRHRRGVVDIIDRYTKELAVLEGRFCIGLSEDDAKAAFIKLDAAERERRAKERARVEAEDAGSDSRLS